MKNTISIFISALFFFTTSLNANPTFFLKIEEVVSNDTECILEISIAGSEAMALGSSNLQFLYDELHLANPSLVSSTFDVNYNVTVTEPTINKASLNIELFIPEMGKAVEAFPVWTILGQVRFDVIDQSESEEITWSYNGGTTETVVFIDDESTQIFVGDPASDLYSVLHGTVVSVPEIPAQNDILVYPNPFNDQIRIDRSDLTLTDNLITLSDSEGKVIRQFIIDINEQVISLDRLGTLAPGIYFLTIGNENGPVTHKIAKN